MLHTALGPAALHMLPVKKPGRTGNGRLTRTKKVMLTVMLLPLEQPDGAKHPRYGKLRMSCSLLYVWSEI